MLLDLISWDKYLGHILKVKKKRDEVYDNNIYTFDIETTSCIILDGKQYETEKYLSFTDDEKDRCTFNSCMYIWMFSINEFVYYGRTWDEFRLFLEKLEAYTKGIKKYVFVHNLSWEFQFLRNIVKFKNVFSRKSRRVIKCELSDYNIEFRCTYYMTNVKLERLPSLYNLPVEKLTGNLDYSKFRHSKSILNLDEKHYCENDCLVVYYYIKLQLEKYKTVNRLPLTATGFVRKELKNRVYRNFFYKRKVKKAINIDGHIFNLLDDAFMGGYTHANWTKAKKIIKNVTSYDFTSSYPYVMMCEKYPSTIFKKCHVTDISQILDCFCYIVKVTFYNISCKYWNNFISSSKCVYIKGGKYDNGRIIGAKELQIVLTDIDLKFIFDTHKIEKYNFDEVYYSKKDYLPKELIEFILEKYENKTKFKGVAGKEVEYSLEKRKV